MFLGERVLGVYDILHFKEKYGKEWDLEWADGMMALPLKVGKDGKTVVVQVYRPSENTPVLTKLRRIPSDPESSLNEWPSLLNYFASEIKATQERMKSTSVAT